MAVTPRQDKTAKPAQNPTTTSSPGDSPVEMTPMDISPEDATWKDRTQRNLHSEDAEEKADAMLDEASDLSFPASDPIAVNSVTRVEKNGKQGKSNRK